MHKLDPLLSAKLKKAVYPLLCVLSLALLPYQPEHDPAVVEAARIAQALTSPLQQADANEQRLMAAERRR
jgi:hypothetical protein